MRAIFREALTKVTSLRHCGHLDGREALLTPQDVLCTRPEATGASDELGWPLNSRHAFALAIRMPENCAARNLTI